jgi:ribosome modulation factor
MIHCLKATDALSVSSHWTVEAVAGREPVKVFCRLRLGPVTMNLYGFRVQPIAGDGTGGPYRPFDPSQTAEFAQWSFVAGGTRLLRATQIEGFDGLWLLASFPAPVVGEPLVPRRRTTRRAAWHTPARELEGVPGAPREITWGPGRGAWRLGWAAGSRGEAESACPYDTLGINARLRAHWLEGRAVGAAARETAGRR